MYTIGNDSGPWLLVRIMEVSVIGGVRCQSFHCIHTLLCLFQVLLKGGKTSSAKIEGGG